MAAGGLRRWVLALQPGKAHDVVAADWADTLVVVATGDLQLECCTGRRATFPAGSVLTLAGLSVRCLHNPGPSALVLHAVTRDRTADDRHRTSDR